MKKPRHKCSNCDKVRYERFMLKTGELHANRRDPKWICRDCINTWDMVTLKAAPDMVTEKNGKIILSSAKLSTYARGIFRFSDHNLHATI